MASVADQHFPIIKWQDQEKHLWNPVHKKILKNRPEERVRLRIIEFLLEAGWSRYRITTEEALQESGLRTDIICYSQEFEPQILMECKAENVPLSGKAAEQIARYNQHIQAPYLLLSNGCQDYWFGVASADRTVRSLEGMPEILGRCPEARHREFGYWKERGFAGSKAAPALRRWLESSLAYFADPALNKSYLQFRQSPADLDLSHYYHIVNRERYKVALSFLSTAYGGSRIIGIFNQEGENRAIVEVNLDLVFKGEVPNTSVYSREGTVNTEICGKCKAFEGSSDFSFSETISMVEKIFGEHHRPH